MIPRDRCAAIAHELRAHPGVHRVIIAGADGRAHYDDLAFEARDQGAAAAATLAAVSALVAQSVGVESPEGSVIYGAAQQVITRAVGSDLVLVVVAAAGAPGTGVYRAARRAAAQLTDGEHKRRGAPLPAERRAARSAGVRPTRP
ncbi:roadblock/LC7 domain-containing protein [Demequina sp. NBRC 110053]|uniref:roadblock/LC7 domain-containing protein n=1 Tax=Demequina sp. NBRC 110053 TaxID=1570342 RepID=UPI000A062F7C|nr:roadblock/LC7 domain-containing protein [Demequina sp. NBRC 110053]